MTDQGFDFKPKPPTRAPTRFEPPPWEQAQFEEVKRIRQEEAQRHALLIEGLAEEQAQAGVGVEEPVAAPEQTASDTVRKAPDEPVIGVLDEKQLALMFGDLRREEPPAMTALWKVSVAAAAVIAAVGSLLTVWGTYALVSTKSTGMAGALGGLVLLVFGLGFVGMGGWMAFRTLRQQGVL